jgi:hypothetical protein
VGGNFETRTPGDAALALGVEIADLQPLVDSGVLRVLPVAGGGWVTSDAAIVRAARIRSGVAPAPRRRRSPRSDGAAAGAARQPSTTQRARSTPPSQAPPPPPAPAPEPPRYTPGRRVPVDRRPDVLPEARLDMREVARRLRISEREATSLARSGRLRATRLGREWITTERAMRDYAAEKP